MSGQWELDARLDQIDKRIDKVEQRLERLESRVGKIETDVAVLKWMVGFTLAVNIAILFFVWQIMLRLPV